ncbi:YceD family protein [Sandaracinobacteroides saxicola]|uniref:DUF177 domain-containing protein n=1 Tax=Sandaracinobacteroides saxicola TaxID=2759707 RepID=A0A7G5IF44_9SPHN|nr:DUF177 domain-containing protein [Sandaracinobacteroides saxicola]QMW21986.1 DUF177 domain-containing protein [Sandaracinobacteroides saxicola]
MGDFELRVPLERLGATAQPYRMAADDRQRAALAARYDLIALERLEAVLEVARTADGAVATGRVTGRAVQACVVSGEPVVAEVDEAVSLRFAVLAPGEEVELADDELDVVPIEGGAIDLGAAVAETLLLALPAFPRADEAVLAGVRRRLLSEEEAAAQIERDRLAASPFAKLKR